MSIERGKFVVCEGGVGAGKSSQKDLLIDPYAALFAYSAARANLINLKVIPDLKEGTNVGLDRYWYSTYAYQGAQGVSKPVIWAISLLATRSLKPDVVLHYDLLPEIGRERKMRTYQSDIDRFVGCPKKAPSY